MRDAHRFLRRWRLSLTAASFLVIFGVLAVGHPETVAAGGGGGGCAEFLGCATDDACDIMEGESCDECEAGIKTCAEDKHNQCTTGPACSLFDCKVNLCVDWEGGGGGEPN